VGGRSTLACLLVPLRTSAAGSAAPVEPLYFCPCVCVANLSMCVCCYFVHVCVSLCCQVCHRAWILLVHIVLAACMRWSRRTCSHACVRLCAARRAKVARMGLHPWCMDQAACVRWCRSSILPEAHMQACWRTCAQACWSTLCCST